MRIPNFICLLFVLFGSNFIEAQSNWSFEGNLNTQPSSEATFNESNMGISHNYKKGNYQFEVDATYKNTAVKYDFNHENWANKFSKFNSLTFDFVAHYNWSNNTNLSATITPSYNYQTVINSNDFFLLGELKLKQKLGKQSAISIGVNRSFTLGKLQYLPSFAWNQKLNHNMELQIGFPESIWNYSNNERNTFRITNLFNGTIYNLENSLSTEYVKAQQATISQMTSSASYERKIDEKWLLKFQAGYNFNRSYKLIDNDSQTIKDFEIKDGALFSLGIKYKL